MLLVKIVTTFSFDEIKFHARSVATKKNPLTWAQHQKVDPNWYFDTTTDRFKS